MATETTTSTKTATPSIILEIPAADQTVVVDIQPNQVIEVPFDMTEANVTLMGGDLRIEFPGNAVLILSDFATMVDQGVSPLMMFVDGSVVAGDVLLTALTTELPETAAGPAGGSGGAGEYEDDMGNLIGTVDRLGVQNPDPFARSVELQQLDEQPVIPAEPIPAPVPVPPPPPEPVNQPPVAEDNVYRISAGQLRAISEGEGLFSNDFDPDGDPIAVTDIVPPTNVAVNASNGSLTIDATTAAELYAAYQALDEGEALEVTFPYTIADPSGATATANVTIIVEGANDPPAIITDSGNPEGAVDIVYEAGLQPDGSGVGPTAVTAEGTITIGDPDGLDDIRSITLDGVVMTIGTEAGEFASLAAMVGQVFAGDYGTLELTGYAEGAFTYRYTLDTAQTHTQPDSDTSLSDSFIVTVDDGSAPPASATVMVDVIDDVPFTSVAEAGTLAIGTGNSLTADLNITFGADNQTGDIPIQLSGPTLDGYVVDNAGHYLTADNIKLVYLPDGDGGLMAVKDTDHDFTAFTVDVDAATDSYTVTIVDGLDGLPVPVLIDLSSFRSLGGGVTPTFVFDVNLDEDVEPEAAFVTTASGDSDIINYNNNALGVGNGAKINDGDSLRMEYHELTGAGDVGALKSIHQATFEAWHLSGGEKVYYKVYSGGLDGDVVGEGEFTGTGNPSGYETFTINVGENFDTIEFYGSGSGGGYGYGINNLTIYEQGETAGTDYQITYDFIATDADLDTAPGSFDVTFDGTPEPEVLTESQVFDTGDEAGVPPGGDPGMFNSNELNSLTDPNSYNNDPDHSAT